MKKRIEGSRPVHLLMEKIRLCAGKTGQQRYLGTEN
jgi:hypothetical protein